MPVTVERYDSSRPSGIREIDRLLRGSSQGYVIRAEGVAVHYAFVGFAFPRLVQLGFDPGAAVIHDMFTPPRFRGKKLQSFMIRHIVEDLSARHLAEKVYAEIRPDNVPSLNAFLHAGFRKTARIQGIKSAGVVFRSRVLPVSSGDYTWVPIPRSNVVDWNGTLLRTGALFLQYPFWLEAMSRWFARPRYFCCCSPDGEPVAYAALLAAGFPGFRIGLLDGGPVGLISNGPMPDEVFAALWSNLRSLGYFCVRFSQTPPSIWNQMSASCASETRDPFPWYASSDHREVVDQLETDAETLATFKDQGRQEIQQAASVGYKVESSGSPEAIRMAWPVIQAMKPRGGAGTDRRHADNYERLIALAAPYRCARTYLSRVGQRAVQAMVLVRDRDTAHCVARGIDVKAFDTRVSPSCLAHWTAMRDFHREGVRIYDFGGDSVTVGWFQSKFSLRRIQYPPTATAVLNSTLYRVWKAVCACVRIASRHRRGDLPAAGKSGSPARTTAVREYWERWLALDWKDRLLALMPRKYDMYLYQGTRETLAATPPISTRIPITVEHYGPGERAEDPWVDTFLIGSREAYVGRVNGVMAHRGVVTFAFRRAQQFRFPPGACVIEGFTLREYRGLGLQPVVRRLMLEDILNRGGTDYIYAEILPDNVVSMKGIERAGWRRVARLKGIKFAGFMLHRRVLPPTA